VVDNLDIPKPLLASVTDCGLHVLNGRENVACSSERAQVIFDGVLFNRRDLQSRFAPDIPGASDPELVLAAYLRLGTEFIHQLKGIFILAVWDEDKRGGFCARDRLGVYPFFYTEAGGSLLISSSIPELLHDERVCRNVNRSALARRLLHLGTSREETFHEKILLFRQGIACASEPVACM